MKPIQKRLSLEQMTKLFERFHDSGLSLAAFARQENIPYPTLINYKKRLNQAGFPSVSFPHPPKHPIPNFLQLLPPTPTPPLILRCGHFEVQLQEGFNPNLLGQVLEVLKQHV